MLGEKLELDDISFLFQEHTSMSKVIETSNAWPLSQVSGSEFGREGMAEHSRTTLLGPRDR